MFQIVQIQPYLVRIYDIVVIPDSELFIVHAILSLILRDIFSYHIFFVAIFQTCRAGYPGTQFQYLTILAFKFIGITRDIRARADKTHLADEHIPKFRKFVKLIMAEFCSQGSNSVLSGNAYRRTAVVYNHSAELVAFKKLTVFAYPILDKKDRTGHLDLNQKCNDKQDRPQKQQTESTDYSVEEPFKQHTDT